MKTYGLIYRDTIYIIEVATKQRESVMIATFILVIVVFMLLGGILLVVHGIVDLVRDAGVSLLVAAKR